MAGTHEPTAELRKGLARTYRSVDELQRRTAEYLNSGRATTIGGLPWAGVAVVDALKTQSRESLLAISAELLVRAHTARADGSGK